jgi:branched-chain amino acid transport system ATP-binding protein
MEVLRVSHLNVKYGKVQALWDVGFYVGQTEVVAILGANGAGKTSLVHSIAGLVTPSSGEIFFNTKRIDGTAPHLLVNAGISLIPERRRLFIQMTVKENLLLGAYNRQARKSLGRNLTWVLNLFPRLKERKNQKAGTLSGGEAQMLAIGRGLMANPKLLILDEPSTGLAPLLIANVFETIKKTKEEGITVLLVEQNVSHALKISDRALLLENGRLTLEGNAREILNQTDLSKIYFGEQ